MEDKFEALAGDAFQSCEYETERFPYVIRSHYLPDWRIAPLVFVETKGYFSSKNRSDLLSFREQYPHVTILLMFEKSNNKLNSRSKTTYGEWATKHGFDWADIRDGIPRRWVALAKKKNKKDKAKNDSTQTGTD